MVDKVWSKFSNILGVEEKVTKTAHNEMHIVTAALMIHVSFTHDDFSEAEKVSVLSCIQDHFDLDGNVAHQIVEKATGCHENAIDLYGFTRVIMKELEQEGQKDIVRLLYRVAFADKHLDHFEDQIIAKISGLLGIGVRDRVLIKQEVRAETKV